MFTHQLLSAIWAVVLIVVLSPYILIELFLGHDLTKFLKLIGKFARRTRTDVTVITLLVLMYFVGTNGHHFASIFILLVAIMILVTDDHLHVFDN